MTHPAYWGIILQYLFAQEGYAELHLENIRRENIDGPSQTLDPESELDADSDYERDDLVQRISDAREMLTRRRRLLQEFQTGNYAEIRADFERTLDGLRMAREALDGPAFAATHGPDALNRLREKNVAKQAAMQGLIDLLPKE